MKLSAFTSFLRVIFTLSLILSLSWCETVSTTESTAAAEVSTSASAGSASGAGADVGAGKASPTPSKVAEMLEAALKTAQEILKAFCSADPYTFVNSLSNTAGTLPPWITAFAAAYQSISALFIPTPPDADKKVVLEALEKINKHLFTLTNVDFGIRLMYPTSLALDEFQKKIREFFNFSDAYVNFSLLVVFGQSVIKQFVKECDSNLMGLGLANWIESETTKQSPVWLMGYFQDSCNYTEILGWSRDLAGVFIRNTHLFSFCYGLKQPSNPESEARDLDGKWASIAKKLHENLMNKREFKNCRPVLTDSLDSYGKKNKDLDHQKFATDLSNYFYEKFRWINWYVLSFDQGVSGPSETSCISGRLSICLQRQYGRNLFIAGQQAEDNYFYSRNCPAHKDCIAMLQEYQNCADATKPFHECMKTKCKEPAGTICQRKSDHFAAEKGQSTGADGWIKSSFGSGNNYLMYVVSP